MRSLAEHVLLLEYDHDVTWAKYGDKISQKMRGQDHHSRNAGAQSWPEDHIAQSFDAYSRATDPTPHREYGKWIAQHYAGGGIRSLEDLHTRVKPALARFHDAKIRKQLQKNGINPDINTHKGLSSLEDAVEKLPQQERKDDAPGPDEFDRHEEDHWKVFVPHTEKASQHYGRGTRWCTAATEGGCAFDSYNRTGPLHVFVSKNPQYPGEKYQAHIPSGSFMNERDEPVNFRKIFDERPSPYFNGVAHEGVENALTMNTAGRDAWHHQGALKFANVEQLSRAIQHPDENVRMGVAKLGIKRINDHLINDPHHNVRMEVAFTATQDMHHDHMSRLVNDPNRFVRSMIARWGPAQHVKKLVNDPEPSVADAANKRLRDLRMVADRGGLAGWLRHG